MASDYVKAADGSTALLKTCLTNGLTIITGGAGIADMTLGKPFPGCRAVIRILSTAGDVVVTAATGTTLDGTNTIATFDTAEDTLILVYNGSSTWAVEKNVGVVLS